jgi:hypothetical protein
LAVTALGSTVSGAIDVEIAMVAKDSVWLGLRNSFAATGVGLGALFAYNSLAGPRREDEWEQWDEFDYEAYEPESREAPPY